MRKPVYGVGINDANYKTTHCVNNQQYPCPVYTRWMRILATCYSEYVKPEYIGYTVSKEWLTFSNFSLWYALNAIEGYYLKVEGLIYSAETCSFVETKQ